MDILGTGLATTKAQGEKNKKMCPATTSISITPVLLGLFVFVSALVWWLNSKLDEILREIKKRK